MAEKKAIATLVRFKSKSWASDLAKISDEILSNEYKVRIEEEYAQLPLLDD